MAPTMHRQCSSFLVILLMISLSHVRCQSTGNLTDRPDTICVGQWSWQTISERIEDRVSRRSCYDAIIAMEDEELATHEIGTKYTLKSRRRTGAGIHTPRFYGVDRRTVIPCRMVVAFPIDFTDTELPGKPEWPLRQTEDVYLEDLGFRARQIIKECIDKKNPQYEPLPGWMPLEEGSSVAIMLLPEDAPFMQKIKLYALSSGSAAEGSTDGEQVNVT